MQRALSGPEHAGRLKTLLALRPGPRTDGDADPSKGEVAFMAEMPDLNAVAHQPAREGWLLMARLDRYDMRRLPDALRGTLTGITVVPGDETVVLDLADGGRVFDMFRRMIFCAPAGLLSAEDWTTAMAQRGWAVTIFSSADEILDRLSEPVASEITVGWSGRP